VFLEKTNYDLYVRLILTSLLRELQGEEKMYENIDSLQEIRVTIEGKVLVFQERSSTVCREIFSEGVRCA
jgi:hypothetical protein